MESQSPYEILDIPEDATDAQIRQSFLNMCRIHHPDKIAGSCGRDFGNAFANVEAAFQILQDPKKRQKWHADRRIRTRKRARGTEGAKRTYTRGNVLLGRAMESTRMEAVSGRIRAEGLRLLTQSLLTGKAKLRRKILGELSVTVLRKLRLCLQQRMSGETLFTREHAVCDGSGKLMCDFYKTLSHHITDKGENGRMQRERLPKGVWFLASRSDWRVVHPVHGRGTSRRFSTSVYGSRCAFLMARLQHDVWADPPARAQISKDSRLNAIQARKLTLASKHMKRTRGLFIHQGKLEVEHSVSLPHGQLVFRWGGEDWMEACAIHALAAAVKKRITASTRNWMTRISQVEQALALVARDDNDGLLPPFEFCARSRRKSNQLTSSSFHSIRFAREAFQEQQRLMTSGLSWLEIKARHKEVNQRLCRAASPPHITTARIRSLLALVEDGLSKEPAPAPHYRLCCKSPPACAAGREALAPPPFIIPELSPLLSPIRNESENEEVDVGADDGITPIDVVMARADPLVASLTEGHEATLSLRQAIDVVGGQAEEVVGQVELNSLSCLPLARRAATDSSVHTQGQVFATGYGDFVPLRRSARLQARASAGESRQGAMAQQRATRTQSRAGEGTAVQDVETPQQRARKRKAPGQALLYENFADVHGRGVGTAQACKRGSKLSSQQPFVESNQSAKPELMVRLRGLGLKLDARIHFAALTVHHDRISKLFAATATPSAAEAMHDAKILWQANLAPSWAKTQKQLSVLLLRWFFNCWETDTGLALVDQFSSINHSCNPNCEVVWTTDGCAALFALKSLRMNEALTISYLSAAHLNHAVEKRRQLLYDGWGFRCQCIRCQKESL
eukprot:TRINITY_DN104822_c0_g1_i1.p1 TRINITY_DN104822_c0_g1~~TRINITY_DN104822_c0_g1_i1.p1  ORF type:complete len:852 (-),score=119.19 TRINITY_DN104822_c0_g1_i1:151-2706(-)